VTRTKKLNQITILYKTLGQLFLSSKNISPFFKSSPNFFRIRNLVMILKDKDILDINRITKSSSLDATRQDMLSNERIKMFTGK